MHTTWTRLLVMFTKKPDSPRETIFLVRPASSRMSDRRRRRMAFFPVRKAITHAADSPWEKMVASAAPRTPMPRPKMSTGSSTMFTTAPSSTVIIPVLPKPWALMKGFIPRLIMTNRVPHR